MAESRSPQEPLELSAPLARQLAPQLCRRDPASGESCAWYHGFWQYLRLLGMGTTPAGHSDFFRQAFARAPASARVLVAGGADYGMLAHAAAACRAAGLQASFAMLDWCETPLRLSRWYAERESLSLRTERRDLLATGENAAFDVVCTQALLGHFPPAQRPRLLASLHGALRPGGMLVTAQRLRPGAPDAPARFSASQVEDFAATVLAKARDLPGIDAVELATAARQYASRQISWPVRSADDMRSLFGAAGFDVENLSSAPMTTETGAAGLNAPTVAGGANYARIIARKRPRK